MIKILHSGSPNTTSFSFHSQNMDPIKKKIRKYTLPNLNIGRSLRSLPRHFTHPEGFLYCRAPLTPHPFSLVAGKGAGGISPRDSGIASAQRVAMNHAGFRAGHATTLPRQRDQAAAVAAATSAAAAEKERKTKPPKKIFT